MSLHTIRRLSSQSSHLIRRGSAARPVMAASAVLSVEPLDFVWGTADPFLFCVHHNDDYPPGDERQAPPASALRGRAIGNDFTVKDGFRMYHGATVPGFPRHPHRGFETITLVRRGFIDHSDSLGATARFGNGDCQWMTAGAGIEHCEMFPLRQRDARNPLELFQIWINLPAANKMVLPHFTMLWAETIPPHTFRDAAGRSTTVVTVAGALPGAEGPPPPPPPHSWAAAPENCVALWTIKMEPQARWTVPAGPAVANRMLYLHQGTSMRVAGREVSVGSAVKVQPGAEIELQNGDLEGELLMLQGRPIGEEVVQRGPFVMNSAQGIQDAFADYRRGAFGKWPWPADDPVHPRERERFAIHADGHEESP